MGEIIVRKVKGMSWMLKISLVLVFTMLFSTFMYQGWYKPKFIEAAPTSDGRIFYSVGTTTPQNRSYAAATNTFSAQAATFASAIPNWMVMKSAPSRNEMMAGHVDAAQNLYIYKWNGTTWVEVTNSAAPDGWGTGTRPVVGGNGVNGRRFDIAYESVSGRAMVVYSRNVATTDELAYRIWDGSTWSAAVNINPARITGIAGFVKLVPKAGANEITMAVQDVGTGAITANNAALTVMTWNGTAWGSEPAAAVSTGMQRTTASLIQIEGFDVAYESTSGDRLVAYTQPGGTAGIYYQTYIGSTLGGATSMVTYTSPGIPILRSDPYSDNILVMYSRGASANIYGRVWSGTALGASTTLGTGPTSAVSKRQINGAWLRSGGTSFAVAFWQSATATTLNYRVYDGTAGTWATAATFTVAAAAQWIDVDVDPYGEDTLMLTYSDSASDLFAKRVVTNGTGALTFTNADGGAAISAALTNITTQNFDFAYNRLDTTPPTFGTVTVSPDTGTYTSSSPTITTVFTDTGSPVTSCEYTTNGTFPGTAGVVSGSGPDYTCTGTPTGLTGSLTINMRATSAGGTGTATQITRTVDTTGPTDGTLTITEGSGQNTLNWTAASDAQSGLRATNTYDLRYSLGNTPPTCTTGISIYQGTLLTYLHTNLTGPKYSYRVCAYDRVDNPSAGASRTTTAKWGSAIAACGSCHAYPPTDGTRDGDTGALVGDHQKHNYICATCHVAPATETSTDFPHRTGTIQMQASISGGSYSKASPITQVNNPTTGTCSNVSCHGGSGTTTPVWGVGSVGCIDCHNGSVASSTAQGLGGPATRVAIVPDFSLTSRHTRSRGTAVTSNDCGVCHMEGNAADGSINPAYHANGYIELRDPDLGTTIKGVTHSGTTSAPGVYSSTGTDARPLQFSRNLGSATLEADTQAIMVNLCLKCHDSGGAASPLAQVPGGTAGRPFAGTIAANPSGNVLDVSSQFAGANRSQHPILVRNNNGYTNTNSNRMLAPWTGVAKTGTTTVYGPLMTCWDCHAPNNTLSTVTLTSSGVHGATPNGTDSVELRGNVYQNSATATTQTLNLCVTCHNPTYLGTAVHTTGSAWTAGNNGSMTYTNNRCYYCHSSANTTAKPARPIPAEDVHGFSTYPGGGAIPAGDGYAFMRRSTLPHSVRQVGATTYTANCGNGTGICSQNMGNYTPGGVY